MTGVLPAGHKSQRILVGVTGSVAAIKLPQLVRALIDLPEQPEVQVVTTDHAMHFFNQREVPVPVHLDADEWRNWSRLSDPVLHIELRQWADLLLIAPLDANTLGKLAMGLCDNLLTCVARAWDSERPFLFCPAMNTHMWTHPLTRQHVEKLCHFGYVEVPCVCKTLACGETGMGAMAEVSTIVKAVRERLWPDERSQVDNG
uniref:phosphopantothenoylcysteine decarboxylase isoform X2 n=1 Tax=Myxine glutinosa TaxID=7769 RepID=UPI00358EA43F